MSAAGNTAVERFIDQHEALDRRSTDNDWLTGLRRRGRSAFEHLGFPGRRDEDWKYTNLRAVQERAFHTRTADAPHCLDTAALPAIDDLDARRLTFVDGQLLASLSDFADLPDGVCIRALPEALANPPARLRETLLKLAVVDSHPFAALNTAMLNDGVWIDIAAGADAGKPLLLVFFSSETGKPVAAHPRVVVTAGRQSRFTLIEQFAGQPQAAGLCNTIAQLDLADGATVRHYRLQEESLDAFHLSGIHVDQARDSRYESHNVQLGAALARTDIHVALNAPGASVLLNGFYLASGRQHVDNHTRVDHLAAHTDSTESYRGVLDGRARAVFNGKAIVHPGAARTDARQSNRNLLLSPSAEVDTKPELEIYADDVKCSHGATIGQLDDNAMFYLLSRGIDRQTARSLLTFAFADEVIARLDNAPLRRYVERQAARRLPDSDTIREFV